MARGLFRHPPQPQQRLTTVQPPPPPPAQTLTVPLLESGGAYSTTVLTDTPSGYWRLGEPSGTTATDASGNGKTGTYGGGVAPPTLGVAGLLTADVDTAVSWNGNTNYSDVQVDSVATLFDGTKNWTIELWTKQTTDASFPYLFSATSAAPKGIAFITSSNLGLILGREDAVGNDQAVAAAISSGVTHHVVGTFDGSNLRIYVDGALTGGPTASTRSTPTGTEASIGNYTQQSLPMTGVIDEVAVYNTALSAARILAHYTAGTTASAPAVYAPTIVAGPAQITVPLLDSGPALYAPTIAPKSLLTIPALDAANALYAPTLTPKNTLTVPLLDAAPALYAPAVLATQALVVPVLDAVNATYAPTITPAAVTLTVPALDASNALYAPSVGFTITLGTIDGANALYAPVTYLDQFVTVPVLDAANALYAPSVGFTLTVPVLDAVNVLYAPTLAPQPVTLTIPALDAVNALYAPTVAQVGGALQTITLGLLDASGALYAPSVGFTLTVPQLDAVNAVYAPSLRAVNTLTVPVLDANNALYAPTLTVGAVTVTLPLLDSGPAVYAPSLTAKNTLTLGVIDGVATVYAPTLLATSAVTVPQLVSTSALYAPSVTPAAWPVIVPYLDAVPAVYAPTVVAAQFLTLPTIYGGLGATTLDDEFSGSTLNSSVWLPTYTGGDPGYGLDSHFMGDNRQVTVQSGYARITAQRVGGTVTGNASTDVITTAAAHNFAVDDPVSFYSLAGGAGLANFDSGSFAATTYYIKTTPSSTTFTVSASVGGATLNFTTNITSGSCRLPFDRLYKSASIGTNGTFSQQYGTWEARVRYPAGQGVFPAFWMLAPGSPATPPELDIFEAFPAPVGPGGGSGTEYLSSGMNTSLGIYPAGGADAPALWYDSRGDLTLDWHVHTMVWTPATVQIWIDGIDRGTYTNAAKIGSLPAMYPLLTFAMGAGGYRVDDTAATPDTLTMDVDYIRVYAEAAGAVLFPPTVTTYKAIVLPLLDSGPTLYAPVVYQDQFLTPPLLDSGPALYAPAIGGQGTLVLLFIDSGATLYAPTITPAAVGLTVPLLTSTATVYAPSLTTANTLTLGTLDASNALYGPSLTPKNTLTLGTIDAAPALYAPTFAVGAVTLNIGLLTSAAAIYDLTLTAVGGGVSSITVPLLDAGNALYAPTVAPAAGTITLGTIDAARAVYAPTVVNLAPYITLPTLDAGSALYAPAVTPSWIVSVPLLDGVATVYAPQLAKYNTLGLDTVDAGRALYPPSLEGGINLPFADIDIVDIDPGDLVLVAAGPAVTLVSVASAGVGTSIAGGGVVLSATSSPVAIVDIEVG